MISYQQSPITRFHGFSQIWFNRLAHSFGGSTSYLWRMLVSKKYENLSIEQQLYLYWLSVYHFFT